MYEQFMGDFTYRDSGGTTNIYGRKYRIQGQFRDWSKSIGGGVGRSREGVGHEVLSLVQGVGRAIFSYPYGVGQPILLHR